MIKITFESLREKYQIRKKILEFENAEKHQNEATEASAGNYIQISTFSIHHNFADILSRVPNILPKCILLIVISHGSVKMLKCQTPLAQMAAVLFYKLK